VSAKRGSLWLERGLAVIGGACLGFYGFTTLDAAMFQREQAAIFDHLRESQQHQEGTVVEIVPPPGAAIVEERRNSNPSERSADAPAGSAVAIPAPRTTLPSPPARIPRAPLKGDLLGMLDIPRLSMSTPVMAGDDEKTLRKAAGHLPDTPRPWELGNSAIAAHRDGLFRPLKKIRIGDEIVMRTVRGDLRYRVRDTKIVMPDDLSVLNQTDTQTLTLITCYPFNYVGAAPKRFIVHADRVSTSSAVKRPNAVAPQPVSTVAAVVSATAIPKPKPRRATGRKSASKASKASQKAPTPAIEELKLPVAASVVSQKKAGNKFMRGLRAFGRAFKPHRADGGAPPRLPQQRSP
jgi:sortase A